MIAEIGRLLLSAVSSISSVFHVKVFAGGPWAGQPYACFIYYSLPNVLSYKLHCDRQSLTGGTLRVRPPSSCLAMAPKKDLKATAEEPRAEAEDAGEGELAERNFLISCLRTQLGQYA